MRCTEWPTQAAARDHRLMASHAQEQALARCVSHGTAPNARGFSCVCRPMPHVPAATPGVVSRPAATECAAACGVRAPGARHALSAALVACRRRRTHLAASFGPLIRRLGPQAGLSHNNQRDPPAGVSGATLDGGEDLPPPLYTYSVYFILYTYSVYFILYEGVPLFPCLLHSLAHSSAHERPASPPPIACMHCIVCMIAALIGSYRSPSAARVAAAW